MIKFMAPLAFGLFRGRGVFLPTCVRTSKKDNEEIGADQWPRRAGLKRTFAALQLLLRTKAINGELRLATARFRLRRGTINLIIGSLVWGLFSANLLLLLNR